MDVNDELELLADLHARSGRQGPGSEKDTQRALEMLNLPGRGMLNILDNGCGSGAQTIVLASQLNGKVTAVDLFPVFLKALDKRAADHGLTDKIIPLKASMDDLPFEENSFDIIWSEGAIYHMGFEKGIREWYKFLKPGGYLAVSEVTWITNNRPVELEEFWRIEYQEIDRASGKIHLLEASGYTLSGYFYLSEESWIKNYYEPLAANFGAFLAHHHHSEFAERVVLEHKEEISFYQKYKEFYSYGFYVARKDNVRQT